MDLNTPEELINDIRLGKMVILMDDEDRENEGDLVIAAESVTPADINFMATHARGLICLTLTEQRCQQLALPLMVMDNREQMQTNFTLSIEAAEGVTTGISAADRAHTVRTAVARGASAKSIIQPGHIFPLQARLGGVLTRAGHTEAGCDLAGLAGFEPAAAIVEIMNEDGSMARRHDLEEFARKHDLKIGTIADLVHHRVMTEKTIELIKEGEIDTDFGPFLLKVYRDNTQGDVHFALVRGDIDHEEATLVRVHLPNTLRDVLCASFPKQKGWNMHNAMERVAKEGRGVIVVLSQQETKETVLQNAGYLLGEDLAPLIGNVKSNISLNVGLGAQILREIGVGKMHLMAQQTKYNALSGFDLEVSSFIAYEE